MNRIKELRQEKGLNMSTVAQKLGIPYTTYVNYEKCVREPNSEMLINIANFFNVSIDYLLGRSDKNNKEPQAEISIPYNPIIHKIPILGRIAAGLPLYAEEHIEGYTYTEHNGGAEYFALKVQGDSMTAAHINDGSMIIVRRQPEVENGQIAVVRVDKEDATVKRFRKDENIVQLIPQSYNPEHQIQIYDLKNTDIEVIGKVVECKVEF